MLLLLCCSPERGILGGFRSILFSIVHLLLELFCFFLINKRQAGPTILELEGVEKGSISVVRPGFEQFLVPYDTSTSRLRTS